MFSILIQSTNFDQIINNFPWVRYTLNLTSKLIYNLYKNFEKEKATICAQNQCITVYGETAKAVNILVIALMCVLIVKSLN